MIEFFGLAKFQEREHSVQFTMHSILMHSFLLICFKNKKGQLAYVMIIGL